MLPEPKFGTVYPSTVRLRDCRDLRHCRVVHASAPTPKWQDRRLVFTIVPEVGASALKESRRGVRHRLHLVRLGDNAA